MKELFINHDNNLDYQDGQSDVYDYAIKIGTTYTAQQLLHDIDISDEVKVLSGTATEADAYFSVAVRSLAKELGDKKVTFELDEYGALSPIIT